MTAPDPRMKVLIVDDDPVNVAVLASALKGLYDVETAADGPTALAALDVHTPDLVLLDVMMPEVDGLEVCRRIRAHPTLGDTPVIFITALDSLDAERAGLEVGAVDYLAKPINLRLAKLRIRNQLELRRQHNLIKQQNALLTEQKAALEATLARVKRLEGILSICMYCKKIRTEGETWQRLERYIGDHSDAKFSHGLCPTCEEEQLANWK